MILDRNAVTLTLVRELGFDSAIGADGRAEEVVFFLGPNTSTRAIGAHATQEAVEEFIAYWEHQVATARAYLNNDRNNKSHEWEST